MHSTATEQTKSVPVGTMCGVKKLQLFEVQFFRHRPTTVLPLAYCQLFEVSPEIHSSGVASRYSCYGKHAACSKPI